MSGALQAVFMNLRSFVISYTGSAFPIMNTSDALGQTLSSGTRTDTNSASIVLALPMDGTNGGTSFGDQSAVIKGSGSAKTITVNGNTNTSTTQSKFYGSSGYFDDNGDYLSIASTSDFAFGTGDFTLEYWIKTTDANFNFMNPSTSTGSGYWGHIIQSSSFNWNDAYAATNLWSVNATAILNDAWHHCAICRASGTTKVFFDGVSQPVSGGTFTDSTNYSGVDAWSISIGNLSNYGGYLQDLRIYKGVAKYTSNFTP
jgi:hypothetical protein